MSQSSTKQILLSVSTTPYLLVQNSCDVCILNSGAVDLYLPNPIVQNYNILFINSGPTPVNIKYTYGAITDTIVIIPPAFFTSLLPNYLISATLPDSWTVVNYGSVSGNAFWNVGGNALTGASSVGSTNNNDVNIIRNNTNYLTLTATGINCNGKILTNAGTPIASSDLTTKNYVDTLSYDCYISLVVPGLVTDISLPWSRMEATSTFPILFSKDATTVPNDVALGLILPNTYTYTITCNFVALNTTSIGFMRWTGAAWSLILASGTGDTPNTTTITGTYNNLSGGLISFRCLTGNWNEVTFAQVYVRAYKGSAVTPI